MAASAIPINSERFDFHGYELSTSRDLACLFCPPQYDVKDPVWPPTISFSIQPRDKEALRVHAHLNVCAEHLRELADKAEKLAPEPWSPERDPLIRQQS